MKEERKLRKLEAGPILGKWYVKGTIFKVVSEDGMRGLDVEDPDGKIIGEIRMIMNQFEWVDEE